MGDVIIIECPECSARITVPAGAKLKRVVCPRCKEDLDIRREAGDPAGRGIPAGHPILLGICAGAAVAMIFRLLAPSLGPTGLGFVVCGMVALFVIVLALTVAIGRILAAQDAEDAASAAGRMAWWSVRFGASGLLLSVVSMVVEGLAAKPPDRPDPVEDAVARVMAESLSTSASVQVANAPQFEEEPWRRANFLLVNPEHFAVAVTSEGSPPRYRVVAKATDDQAKRAQEVALEMGLLIVGVDPGLTRRIYYAVDEGEAVPDAMGEDVRGLLKPRTYLPTSETLVKFFDTRLGRERIGFLISQDDANFEFCDLIPTRSAPILRGDPDGKRPFKTETIEKSTRVRPNSLISGLSDVEVRESAEFLDWCVYNVIQRLQANHDRPAFLLVDEVAADVKGSVQNPGETGLGAAKAEYQANLDRLDAETHLALKNLNAPRDILNELIKQLAEAEETRSLSSSGRNSREALAKQTQAIRAEIARMRELIERENALTSEIRKRLVQAGVLQVERSELAQSIYSQKLAGDWLKRDPQKAVATKLATATHVLITQIRKTDSQGSMALSTRLVDVRTGTILWEDQSSDVPGRSQQPSGPQYEDPNSRAMLQPGDKFQGFLRVNSRTQLMLILDVKLDSEGRLSGELHDPYQKVYNIKLSRFSLEADRLILASAAINAAFSGTVTDGGKTIKGEWDQKGRKLPLTLIRTSSAEAPNR